MKSGTASRRWLRRTVPIAAVLLAASFSRAEVLLETDTFGIRLNSQACVTQLVAHPGGEVIADFGASPTPFLSIIQGNRERSPTRITYEDGRLTADFADPEARMTLDVGAIGGGLRLRGVGIAGEGITRLTLARLTLPQEARAAGWGVSVMALNEYTQGDGHPGMNGHGRANAFPDLGFDRADAAVVVAKRDQMRDVLKAVVTAAPEIPKSSVGGPFALDAPQAYGSYLFAGRNVTEQNVDEIIDLADRLGLNQINMHAVRYGDWQPYPAQYPEGRESLKRVIDRIHAAGMLAGVHTYSEFISKECPYVTPVPDRRLGTDAAFTLAEALPADATRIPVVESTEQMSAITGFFVRNSVTLRIDDELIIYKNVAKEPPYGFLECQRGAYGTRISAHDKGATVHHLRECFGLFVPDGESSLFAEVAQNLASLINECGFDMIYLDALDGSDAVAGRDLSWHYAAKFTLELYRNLKRPVLAEMSTFPHHLWYVRSRAGAWDHPTRSHKAFIDIHMHANRTLDQIFLPAHLGWWRYKTFHTFSEEPTYADDIEHLGMRCLGTNAGVSIQGVSPTTLRTIPALTRLAAITRRCEILRRAHYFNDRTCAELRQPDKEFSLRQGPDGSWEVQPSTYTRHKVTATDNGSQQWSLPNEYGAQVPFIRIQALHSVGPYDETAEPTIATFEHPGEFGNHRAIRAVKATFKPTAAPRKTGAASGLITATNTGKPGAASWAQWTKTFDPPISLAGHEALGVWVHGDGKGEVLNLQLRSPIHMTYAYGEHYIIVDFTGWRYFELVEPDAGDYQNCTWPYRSWYGVYRSTTRYDAIGELSVYVNNIAAGETVTCAVSPVKGLPLVAQPITNPAVVINGRKMTFPLTIPTGSYLEFDGNVARLFAPNGELCEVVTPTGNDLTLEKGTNAVGFACDAPVQGLRTRAMVTIGRYGEPLPDSRSTGTVDWSELAREVDLPRQIIAFDGIQNRWTTICRKSEQNARLDLEVTVHRAAGNVEQHDSPQALVIDSFDSADSFADSPDNDYLRYVKAGARSGFPTAEGVSHELTVDRQTKKSGRGALRYRATSTSAGGWSARGKRFRDRLDLSDYSQVGFWIKGDGLGEILYFQLRDGAGKHLDMKTAITFSDWRLVTFELSNQIIDLDDIEYLILYYNNLPANRTVTCLVDAMHAWRTMSPLRNLSLTVGGGELRIPAELRRGDILRYSSQSGACEIRRAGETIPVVPKGSAPSLQQGVNEVTVSAETPPEADVALTVQLIKEYPKPKDSD